MTPQPEHHKESHTPVGELAPADSANVEAAIGEARFGAKGIEVRIGPDAEHAASGITDALLIISGTPLSHDLPFGHGKQELTSLIVEAVVAARSSRRHFKGSVAVGPDSHPVKGKHKTGAEPSCEISIGT